MSEVYLFALTAGVMGLLLGTVLGAVLMYAVPGDKGVTQ